VDVFVPHDPVPKSTSARYPVFGQVTDVDFLRILAGTERIG